MIIFYDKKTGEIIGTIEGRVHYPHQLNAFIGDPHTTVRVIIGYIDNEKGQRLPQNIHLWQHQLAWENPKHPRKPHKERIVFNKQGDIVGFVKK